MLLDHDNLKAGDIQTIINVYEPDAIVTKEKMIQIVRKAIKERK